MSVGATCSGSVAPMSSAIGGVHRREVDEKAPPGAKAERMVKHIKKGYAKDGKLTDKEKAIAYATAWKAHNKGVVEEGELNEEDKIISPDKGHKLKTGLHGKDKKLTALSKFLPPFKAEGLWVSDRRGNSVLEVVEHSTLAAEVAAALNMHTQMNEGPKSYDSMGNPIGGGYDEYPSNYRDPQQDKPKVVAWVFYNVQPGQEDDAAILNIRQLKNGKWAMPEYDKSGRSYAFRRNEADKTFGMGKRWQPK